MVARRLHQVGAMVGRALALLVLVAAPLARAAPVPERVRARPATGATAAAAAFERAVDDHYGALGDGRPCARGCAQAIVRAARLGPDVALEVRRATTRYGDVYAIVLGGGGAWWAADPIDDVPGESCGMGKCVDQRVRAIAAWRDGDVVWVTLRVGVTVTYLARHTTWRHARQIVVGCRLGAPPRCGRVDAGAAFTEGRAAVQGTTVHVTEDGRRRAVLVTF